MKQQIQEDIQAGRTALGIELGSTRIKAVLIDSSHSPVASGSYAWENRYENGIWTYPLEEVWEGIRQSYAELAAQVQTQYGLPLQILGAIGFSAMMHGYLPFDAEGNQLIPFRTWRNTMTAEAAGELTECFSFQIPQRWSIAHLYQAVQNGEEHVGRIAFLTTLAGYVHWQLTGEKVLGVGEASGMFPIDSQTADYREDLIGTFDRLMEGKPAGWKLRDILPKVLGAGETAGYLTKEGAARLDPSGTLQPGITFCPPEGDAGTGMVATNSVAAHTGNVSAGTSIFAMAVLEQDLKEVHPEIDMVTTPTGKPVAMVHCNNCTNEINAWAGIFSEVGSLLGVQDDPNRLFTVLFEEAGRGEADGGGLMAYNYLSGEPVTGFEAGHPMFYRPPEGHFNLANFMRTQLYSACATLKLGMDILFEKEQIHLEHLVGHGGFFKTPVVGQQIMADAMNTPVAVMETAGEGGAWGCALLAAFVRERQGQESLEQYLSDRVFVDGRVSVLQPSAEGVAGFQTFMERYRKGLAVQRVALENN